MSRETDVPQTKPATEWLNGRAAQKMRPRGDHAHAQGRFLVALSNWADEYGTGRVAPEWDFFIAPPGEGARALVPDLAFLSYERVPFEDDAAAQMPSVAPDVVVEILSPGDTRTDIREKIRVYLAAGSALVLFVDPARKSLVAHDPQASHAFEAHDTFAHPALPKFSLPVGSLFEKPHPRK